jgi:hypothetical protein
MSLGLRLQARYILLPNNSRSEFNGGSDLQWAKSNSALSTNETHQECRSWPEQPLFQLVIALRADQGRLCCTQAMGAD